MEVIYLVYWSTGGLILKYLRLRRFYVCMGPASTNRVGAPGCPEIRKVRLDGTHHSDDGHYRSRGAPPPRTVPSALVDIHEVGSRD